MRRFRKQVWPFFLCGRMTALQEETYHRTALMLQSQGKCKTGRHQTGKRATSESLAEAECPACTVVAAIANLAVLRFRVNRQETHPVDIAVALLAEEAVAEQGALVRALKEEHGLANDDEEVKENVALLLRRKAKLEALQRRVAAADAAAARAATEAEAEAVSAS